MIKRPAPSVAYRPVEFMFMPRASRFFGVSAVALLLANCASEPTRTRQMSAQNQREIGAFADKRKYGSASPRVVQYGDTVPKGGGRDHVGKPYQVAGRWYTPRDNPNYSAVGHSSWYGDAFHGRKTANGEIYDKHAYTAAHPTMPLPSYARVTNMTNNRSIIVRVNDRGPFHGGRIIDVSERVAHALEFKHLGTARVKVDYVQRANTRGSDDRLLVSTLRTDGQMAQLPGGSTPVPSQQTIMVASNEPPPGVAASRPAFAPVRQQPAAAAPPAIRPQTDEEQPATAETREQNAGAVQVTEIRPVRRAMPLPADRPFDLGSIPGAGTPMNRVNNGQVVPVRALTQPPSPPRDRVAAVYFAPDTGFKAAFSGQDPMTRLKPGVFDPKPQKAVGTMAERTLVAGLFKDRRNAERLTQILASHGKTSMTPLQVLGATAYRVTATGFASDGAARAALAASKAAGATDAVIR
jgi:rare lipoprotein A